MESKNAAYGRSEGSWLADGGGMLMNMGCGACAMASSCLFV